MCYSAMIEQQLKKLEREFDARVDFESFEELFRSRLDDRAIKVPRAMEANFAEPRTPIEKQIKSHVDQFNERQTREWESALFAQRKRLADAERTLETRETKKAIEDKRIATSKIEWHQKKLRDLKSTDLRESDSRIYPMWYTPAVVRENGKFVIKPMRYHCRPQGKPDWYDKKYDGLYNARRDNLEGFWKGLFGKRHGVFMATSFFENVALHKFEKRELRPDEKPGNVVLHFNPQQTEPMFVACLWDHWSAPGKPDLLSFAAITDDPPAEVAETGHDRCIVPLRVENIQRWLSPEGKGAAELYSLLDDRARPYYEHLLAA